MRKLVILLTVSDLASHPMFSVSSFDTSVPVDWHRPLPCVF